MFSIIHLLYALLHLGFVIWGWRIYQQQRHPALLLLLLVALGLSYDNAVIGLGRFIGVGDLLETLNIPRFWIHALLTPTLLITALYFARKAGVNALQHDRANYVAGGITLLLIAVGMMQGVVDMELYPACQQDVVRYAERILNADQFCEDVDYPSDLLEQSASPPIASILTILGVIVLGAMLWRHTGWRWLLAGAVFMFIAAAIPPSRVGVWVGGGGEVVLIAAMTATAGFLIHKHTDTTEAQSLAR